MVVKRLRRIAKDTDHRHRHRHRHRHQQQLNYGNIKGAPSMAILGESREPSQTFGMETISAPSDDHQLDFSRFVSSLHWCGKAKALSEGMSLHACIISHGLEKSKLLGNLLVQLYGRCKAIEDALTVFTRLHQKNLFSWNAIISAYACHGQHQKALHLFHQMHRDGITPNKFIFSSIISACCSHEALHEGKNIHALIKKSGLESDVVVGTALLNMYGKCGSMDDAKELFYKLPERDLVMWNAMIAACAQHEQQWDALRLYDQMLQEGTLPDEFTLGSVLDACVTLGALPKGKFIHTSMVASGLETDVVVGTTLINMYGKCGSFKSALETFEIMPEQNRVTFINILSACAAQVAIDEGRQMHTQVVFRGFKLDVNLGNALVNMYGKCSSLIDAHKMFNDMPERDVISWNAVIAVYAQNGQAKNALKLFGQMRREGIAPNPITFVNILSACSHAGLVKEGYQFFVSMERDHGVTPSIDHYNCVVDLLVRAGQLDEAEQLLTSMRIEPTVVSWTTLLGACRIEADLQRGERVAKHVLKLDPSNPAHHVTLANIYAASGKGDDAAKVMNRLRDMDQKHGQVAVQQVEMWAG